MFARCVSQSLGPLGDVFTHGRGGSGVTRALHFAAHLVVDCRRRGDDHRPVGRDDLGIDVTGRTLHAQTMHARLLDGGAGTPRTPETTYYLVHGTHLLLLVIITEEGLIRIF